jgi:pSer/pThr/pTyr-binding forkhead associated (FHA) protein
VRLRFSIRAKPAHARADAGSLASAVERLVEVPFDRGEAVIGRRPDVDIELPFPAVSGQHARFFRDDRGYHLEDLGSANGTLLGQRRLLPHVAEAIAVGEIIDLAGTHLRFEDELPTAGPIPAGEGTATLARRLVHDLFEACPPAECARLVVVSGPAQGRELVLAANGRVFKLGRGDCCDLVLPDDDVSREHAAFERGAEGIVVRDLGSKNGVEVDGHIVDGARCLRDGEIVRVGETRLRVVDPEERYLRQMEESDARPMPVGEAIASPVAPAKDPGSATPASRLPVVAIAIAATALLLALGLVLALAFAT